MKFFQNLPTPVKIGLIAGVLGVVILMGALLKDHLLIVLAVLVVATIIAVLALLTVSIIRKRRESRQGDAFSEGIKQGARNNPQGIAADKARKARLDDLAHVFEEGVSKYRGAGKNLYSLPWYLLVGPPGSGKTEAMRHSSIGFPPGLQDPLQGTGGTLSMHWWFTNTAVVLDTAGRLFMSEGVNPAENSEWKEFLKLLKRTRGKCPVNGMLLAVDVETLLKDNAEQIEKKAGLIARQLDVIQRVLDVRFPVFVLVTKCDRIVGFREFFESMNDPQAQHQMLGWSNPNDLDDGFSPEAVEQHLVTVRESLVKRRRALLIDPVHTEDPSARRTDQVDALFAFPEGLNAIGPRLRRFLELIFVAGEWSPKPLFLRGIYFTSSLQEGRSLDEALAKALGCAIDELPGDAVPRKDKSYFLRDLFTAKVFREKGLVTSAVNVSKAQRARRGILLGSGIAFAAVLIGLSFFGGWDLNTRVTAPAKAWKEIASEYREVKDAAALTSDNPLSIVRSKDGQRQYAGTELLTDEETKRAELAGKSLKEADRELKPGLIFAPLAFVLGDSNTLNDERLAAHRAVLEASVLTPLFNAAREKLAERSSWGLGEKPGDAPNPAAATGSSERAAKALAQLLRVDTFADGKEPASIKASKGDVNLVDVAALIDLLEDRKPNEEVKDPGVRKQQISELQDVINATYMRDGKSVTDWPPAALCAGDDATRKQLALAVENFREAGRVGAGGGTNRFALASEVFAGIKDFQDADVAKVNWPSDNASTPSGQRTLESFERSLTEWRERTPRLIKAADRVNNAVKLLGRTPIDSAFIESVVSQEKERIEKLYATLQSELPEKGGGLLDRVTGSIEKSAERKVDDKAKKDTLAGDLKRDAKESLRDSGGPDIDKLLSQGKTDAIASAEAQGRKFRDMLSGAGTESLLRRVKDDDLRIQKRRLAVERASKMLEQAKTGPEQFKPAEGMSLSETAKAVDGERDALATDAGLWDLDGPTPGGLSGVESVRKAADAARAAHVSRLIGLYLETRLSAGRTGLSEIASKMKVSEPAPQPLQLAILDATRAGVVNDAFRPAAAKAVFADFVLADEELSAPATRTDRALNGDKLRTPLESLRGTLNEYALSYFKYWSEEARLSWQPKQFPSWREFHQAMSQLSVDGASEQIAGFLKDQVARALMAIPETRPATGGGGGASAGAQEIIPARQLTDARRRIDDEITALQDRPLRVGQATALISWKQLPADSARSALEAIIAQASDGTESIEQKYFAYTRGTSGRAPSSEFWTGVWVEGFRLLAKDRAEQAGALQAELKNVLSGFPLVFDSSKNLTLDEVKRASEIMNGLVGKPLSKAIEIPNPSPDQATVLATINRGMMRSAVADMAPGFEQRTAGVRALAKTLSKKEGVAIEFTVVYGAPPNKSGSDLAAFTYPFVAVLIDGKKGGDNPANWSSIESVKDGFPFEATLGLSEVSVQLVSNLGAASADLTFSLKRPWNLLEGLRDTGDKAFTEIELGRTVWYLPFTAADSSGKSYRLWLKMREKINPPSLPLMQEWPRKSDLPV